MKRVCQKAMLSVTGDVPCLLDGHLENFQLKTDKLSGIQKALAFQIHYIARKLLSVNRNVVRLLGVGSPPIRYT